LSQNVVGQVLGQLPSVLNNSNYPDNNGGLFTPNKMWAAVVDRKGVLCAVTSSAPDAWPGSRAIAIAKAYTANAFSNSNQALSTANLYGPTQPGGFLYGLNNSNPFNSLFAAQGTGVGFADGGIVTFGGGVALYSSGKVIGGLEAADSGDCGQAFQLIADTDSDHRRMRNLDAMILQIASGIVQTATHTRVLLRKNRCRCDETE
jgi:uncharacterized protein GlcG (DUF336 family)